VIITIKTTIEFLLNSQKSAKTLKNSQKITKKNHKKLTNKSSKIRNKLGWIELDFFLELRVAWGIKLGFGPKLTLVS
jgi:hypothetical protein